VNFYELIWQRLVMNIFYAIEQPYRPRSHFASMSTSGWVAGLPTGVNAV